MPDKKFDKLVFDMPVFPEYEAPNGFLDNYLESHALWYYYLLARNTWERQVDKPIVLEGEKDPEPNFHQLLQSIAHVYGIKLEGMVKCWPQIDKQCELLGLPKLPDEERYRFNRPIIVL